MGRATRRAIQGLATAIPLTAFPNWTFPAIPARGQSAVGPSSSHNIEGTTPSMWRVLILALMTGVMAGGIVDSARAQTAQPAPKSVPKESAPKEATPKPAAPPAHTTAKGASKPESKPAASPAGVAGGAEPTLIGQFGTWGPMRRRPMARRSALRWPSLHRRRPIRRTGRVIPPMRSSRPGRRKRSTTKSRS